MFKERNIKMKEQVNKIQIAMNTIQALEIKATFENMNHLMEVLQLLANVRDDLSRIADSENTEEKEDGNAEAE
jgi:hypothetical protein